VQRDSRQELDELARRLDDLRGGRSPAELADLVLLADGMTAVLLREVECARSGDERTGTGTGVGDGP